ncbi:glycosyltransferase [Bradyrhizobium sp. CSA112]|uniref:glycosyltransferase n=1 Tax=Bradyrhizobium sp. CSA112 TaxID=2699170 RepID=UPI0023B02E97|nr:glycosyltransferase [Bradyrhizobium sp. CSA112]MDE5453020.1 glycosyltransferase [Bradyrhizobium sp. CSA112]
MTDVLFFVGSLAVGGTERHLSQVLPALTKRGWALKMVVFSDGGAFTEPIEAAGIPIEVLPRGFSVPVPKLRGALALVQQTRALAVGLRRRPPRILHCFLPTCCIVGGLAVRMAGFSPVVMSRRSQAARPSSFPGDKSMERWALRHANLVFGHSSRVIDELKAEGIANTKLRLNHNGIDLEAFDDAAGEREGTRRAEQWRPDEIVFATVANLIPYKGHVDLIQAFARLAGNLPWRLVLVGQGGPAFTQQLRELTQRLGIAERVDFLGGRADVPRLLKAADAGILASHQEGFPNAILEYMAASLPVIATATGGNFDAVCENQTGLLIPPAAPELLSQAAVLLLSDPLLRKRLGQAGRRRVESTFSLDACVDRYEDAYRGLLGNGHHHG